MWKRRNQILLLPGVLLAGGLIWTALANREPRYGGHALSYWVRVYETELDDPPDARPAGPPMRKIGTNALPFLLQWTRHEDSRAGVREHLRNVVEKLPESITPEAVRDWAYSHPRERLADAAAVAFDALGTDAKPAIPELSRRMNDPARPAASRRAVLALAHIGKDATPILLAQLADTNALNRSAVAVVLGMFPDLSRDTPATLRSLVRSLEDQSEDVRVKAAVALGAMAVRDRSQASVVVPALVQCLRPGTPPPLRNRAIWMLGQYGEQARESVPPLLRLTTDREETLRIRATNALMKIAPEVLTNAPPQ